MKYQIITAVLSIMFCAIRSAAQPMQSNPSGSEMKTAPVHPPSQPLAIQNVRGMIYQVTGGSGANAGFFIGEKEVIVIDAKMTEESARNMIAEIGKLTPNPVRRVLITHSDRDHVDGLRGFPQDVTVISHENARKDMDAAFKEEALRVHLPSITFSDRATVYTGSARISLIYFGPAHTSGDAVVLFPESKTAFVGDLLTVGRDPLVHLAKNGTSFGLVRVLKAILELDADTFISGHSEIAGRADIEAAIKNLEEKQAKVKALADQGKTLDDVKKAFNVQEGGRWMNLVEVIYRELTEKK